MKVSFKTQEKIYEHILACLYEVSPRALFTSKIASEIARDEEFVKKLLLLLSKKGLVVPIRKNKEGKPFIRRIRWRLSDAAFKSYNSKQY